MARELTNIELTELSLVRTGANRKKFLFFKSSDDGPVLDLLAILEGIDEHYSLSADEEAHIEKVLTTLNVLESEDVESLSNVILLLSKLIATEPASEAVSKQVDTKWPSFAGHFSVAKAETEEEEKPVMTGERAKESLAATFGAPGHDAEPILED